MNKELFESLDILEKEKGISKEYMIERIEAALLSAFRKENAGNENARVKLDPVKQDVKLYKQLTVVDEVLDPATEISLDDAHMKSKRYKLGDIYEIELKTKLFGLFYSLINTIDRAYFTRKTHLACNTSLFF